MSESQGTSVKASSDTFTEHYKIFYHYRQSFVKYIRMISQEKARFRADIFAENGGFYSPTASPSVTGPLAVSISTSR